MLKRIITSLFCLLFIFVSIPIFGFTDFFSVSVYAGTGPDNDGVPIGYSPAGLNDQVDAFRSYCKSRNLFIEGSALDTVSSVTSEIYQHLVADAGLDINQLQNEIYKKTNDNVGAQWFFTTTGISAYNRLFAEFLQNNNLAVGDENVDKTLYSGKSYTDPDGNKCLVWVCTSLPQNANYPSDKILYRGSAYLYNTSQLVAMNGSSVTYHPTTSQSITKYILTQDGVIRMCYQNNYSYGTAISGKYSDGDTYFDGKGIIAYTPSNDKYYFAGYMRRTWSRYNTNTETFFDWVQLTFSSDQVENANVNVTSTVINNNNYEGDTYITNEGDVNPPAETPSGGNDPGWNVGGGQGSYDDGQGNNYTINFPDFELPDLNIDWSIQGLGNKFPFSIPFDIASLVTVLNAEPEAPRFQGTMDLGITTYDYDINLAQFDTVASACRIAELLLLVFGLIMITRSIIKG